MTTTENKKEFNINKPKDFDGNRKDIQSFLLDCKVYLQTNQHVYTTDESKITFVLSFMNEKEAKRWKENYLLSITDPTTDLLNFPNIGTFLQRITKDFKPADRIGNCVCMDIALFDLLFWHLLIIMHPFGSLQLMFN